MLRPLACAVIAIALPAFAITTTERDPVSVPHYSNVRKVSCALGSGTAFNTDRGWLSVAHVTTLPFCQIDGRDIDAEQDGNLDFSRIKVPLQASQFKVNCDGYKVGTWVYAVGYAGGFDWQTMTRLFVTYKRADNGMRVLLGEPRVIPGMSGGPVLNAAGEVVGTINMYRKDAPLSFSVDLKDTSLCAR